MCIYIYIYIYKYNNDKNNDNNDNGNDNNDNNDDNYNDDTINDDNINNKYHMYARQRQAARQVASQHADPQRLAPTGATTRSYNCATHA